MTARVSTTVRLSIADIPGKNKRKGGLTGLVNFRRAAVFVIQCIIYE
jgi:hypothetical protein